ncbi:MAG: NHLP family bacteriocin export ABC transporter peptidase/permease/ATPase subunit [Clostridia bacterium BRH_c25]|nr:MAG: NHLP family bacteriocin export ABC transporter peptidase/permease/ATPase subunit [Clostridia bacterium BRH_c25]
MGKAVNIKRAKTPTVLQMEAVECGAASLAMILGYYDKFIPLEELRTACGVSRDGSKASNIIKAAIAYGLAAKGFRKEPEELKEMQGPMIVHWNFNHFLVVEGFKKDRVYLNDPASGLRTVSYEEFDQSFTGVVLTFEKGESFEKSGGKPNIFTGLKKRLKGSEVAVAFIMLLGVAMVIPGLVIPVFTKIYIDDILLANRDNWLGPLLLGMGITALLRGVITWLQQYYLLKLDTKVRISTSSQFLWHILRLPAEFFSQRQSGDICSRLQSNDRVATLLSGQLATTAIDILLIVFYFALMTHYNMTLALVGVAAAAINVIYLKYAAVKRVDQNRKLLQDRGKLQGNAMSGLLVIETLKATGSEGDFFAKWSGSQTKVLNTEQKMGVSTQILSAIPVFLTDLTNAVVLVLGGFYILNGQLTIGMLVAFQSLMSSFMTPVNNLVSLGTQLQELEGDMNRLDDVFKYQIDDEHNNSADDGFEEKLSGNVEIKNLSFGYSKLEPALIEDFSLTLKPGSRVALIGGSGSGKSTIAKLISGINKPWSGKILFDGVEKDKLSKRVIVNSLSVVDQDICMFSGTIRDNLTLWDDCISDLEVVRAAKDACIHDDITARSGGYEHKLDEGGSNFSGGQRQRLEIARALVTNPTIMILDEATSALDPLTEKNVDESIRRRGCTCIIVAHRLSTIRDCDEIIVLDKGKIIQRGTHDELISVEGHYSNLINAV